MITFASRDWYRSVTAFLDNRRWKPVVVLLWGVSSFAKPAEGIIQLQKIFNLMERSGEDQERRRVAVTSPLPVHASFNLERESIWI